MTDKYIPIEIKICIKVKDFELNAIKGCYYDNVIPDNIAPFLKSYPLAIEDVSIEKLTNEQYRDTIKSYRS